MTFYVSPPIREGRKHEWTFRVIASDRIFSDRSMKNLHVESGSDVKKRRCRLCSESRYIHFLDIFDHPFCVVVTHFARSSKICKIGEDAFLQVKLHIVSVSSLFHVQVARYRLYQCQLKLRHYFFDDAAKIQASGEFIPSCDDPRIIMKFTEK